jgi:hypothetical protein
LNRKTVEYRRGGFQNTGQKEGKILDIRTAEYWRRGYQNFTQENVKILDRRRTAEY